MVNLSALLFFFYIFWTYISDIACSEKQIVEGEWGMQYKQRHSKEVCAIFPPPSFSHSQGQVFTRNDDDDDDADHEDYDDD